MLDKSIPHIGVLMVKSDAENYPRFELPEGFTITGYKQGFEDDWANMMFRVEQTDSLQEAYHIFKDEFFAFPDLLPKQCLYALDPDGKVAATASLWHGNHFGKKLQRIHWVATLPEYQGKGLTKALLTRLFDLYNELGFDGFIYLTSQTWSYKAINIYLKFGFLPYTGQKPLNWTGENETFTVETEKAWDMIQHKIWQYKNP